jgi:rod shape-determining protein MreD
VVSHGPNAYWVIAGSFFVALVLAILPLPAWLQWGRPEWVGLALVYWVIALPHRVGVLTAFLLGVMVDVLEGAVLGQNALALTVVAMLSLTLYQRLRVYNLWQQSAVVFVLVGIHQMICQWVQTLQGVGATSIMFLLPALSSALLWPFVLHSLRGARRRYRVV